MGPLDVILPLASIEALRTGVSLGLTVEGGGSNLLFIAHRPQRQAGARYAARMGG